MRALSTVLLFTALLSGSAVARDVRSLCEIVTKAELRAALGGKPAAPDPTTIGEETAPTCIWTTASGARIKIEIWSGDELKVVGEKTAGNYFASRRKEALKFGGAGLVATGEAAFRTAFERDWNGEIGVLKNRCFLVFAFEHVLFARALKFTKAIAHRPCVPLL